MNVAFVYAPPVHQPFAENLGVVDEDFGRLPPVSLAYAAAVAEQAGHRVTLVDANALEMPLSKVVEVLRPFRPDALAFTVSTYQFRQTTRWMRELRAALGVPTIAGGINVRLFPEETLTCDAIDYGVLHFATRGLPALLGALEHGHDPVGLPEVAARDPDGRVVLGPVEHDTDPFARIGRPARHLLPNDRYYSFISQRKNFTVAVTGTGCAFSCHFCAIASLPRFRATVDAAIAEVVHCVEDLGIREIDFFDAEFFGDRRWARAFCERLVALDLDLEWSCRARIDVLDEDLLRLARRSGCRQIYVGIETPNAEAQRIMGKKLKPAQVKPVLEMMRRVGVRPLGFFMLGVHGETHRTALDTIRFALDLPLDYAQFSRMIAKPGSDLHEELVRLTGRDFWRDWVVGKPVPKRLPNPWSGIDEQALELYTHMAYLAFYLRPRYLVNALRRVRSVDELRRSARTAFRMLAQTLTTDVLGALRAAKRDGSAPGASCSHGSET